MDGSGRRLSPTPLLFPCSSQLFLMGKGLVDENIVEIARALASNCSLAYVCCTSHWARCHEGWRGETEHQSSRRRSRWVRVPCPHHLHRCRFSKRHNSISALPRSTRRELEHLRKEFVGSRNGPRHGDCAGGGAIICPYDHDLFCSWHSSTSTRTLLVMQVLWPWRRRLRATAR